MDNAPDPPIKAGTAGVTGAYSTATLNGHSGIITSMVWSPDGCSLATASKDCTVRIWELRDGSCILLEGHKRPVLSVAYSPDGATLASGAADTTIRLWDTASRNHLASFSGPAGVTCVAWSPNGLLLCSADTKFVRIWNVRERQPIGIMFGHSRWVRRVLWLTDELILSAGDDGEVIIWDVLSCKAVRRIKAHTGPIYDAQIASCLNLLATSSDDKSITLWNCDDFQRLTVIEGHVAGVCSLSVTCDGDFLASASVDGNVRLTNVSGVDSWNISVVAGNPQSNRHRRVAFHPREPVLAATSDGDQTVCLWNLDVNTLSALGAKEQLSRYSSAKVVIVGGSGAGKSCLARALMRKPYIPTPSTHGLRVWHLSSAPTPELLDEVARDVWLWDLAGQSEYKLVHPLFLERTSLAVLAFDFSDSGERTYSRLEYWKNAIERAASMDCPKLLVACRIDASPPGAWKEQVEAFAKAHRFVAYAETSAQTGVGVNDLRETILESIPWSEVPVTASPRLWNEVRAYLLERRTGPEALTRFPDLYEALRQKLPGLPVSRADFDVVIGHAQSQGLLLRLSFGDFVLLKPELLNAYASAIIFAARKDSGGLGALKERDIIEGRIDLTSVQSTGTLNTERALLHAVIELFISKQLALRQGEFLVFPSKNCKWRSPTLALPEYEVSYMFEGPVESIYATLIVRLSYCGVFQLREGWIDAAQFADELNCLCWIVVEDDERGRGTIGISFQDDTSIQNRLLFVRFIETHVHERAIPGSIIRRRTYKCQKCLRSVKEFEAVKYRLDKGLSTIRCLYCDQEIPLIDLLEKRLMDPALVSRVEFLSSAASSRTNVEVARSKSVAQDDLGEFDVFMAYNSADVAMVQELALLLRARGIRPWLDKEQVPPGRWFAQIIQAALTNVRSAAICLGPRGIGDWQRVEFQTLLGQCVRRGLPVIPVLLPGGSIPNDLPFLGQIHAVRFEKSVNEVEGLEGLQFGITGVRPVST